MTNTSTGGLKNSFWFNFLIIILLCIGLYVLFFASLGWFTHHGSEVKVPNVTGQDVRNALPQLEKLGFEVQVDSAYDPDLKPFVVIGQQPEIGAIVKNGRTLFLTVNKGEPLKTAMPNLLGLSFRSAVMLLKSNRLVLGDTTYRPDVAKGAILEQLINGEPIRPGQIISQGSVISLVIGDGLGETMMSVPELVGLTYDEAIATTSASGLKVDAVWDGEITDSSSARIYRQQPSHISDLNSTTKIREGDVIGIWIKQNPTAEDMGENKAPAAPVNPDTSAHKNP